MSAGSAAPAQPYATLGCINAYVETISLRIHLTASNQDHVWLRQTQVVLIDSFSSASTTIGRLNVEPTMRKSVPVEPHIDSYLPERIATILVRSQHAGLVSKEPSTRIDYLLEIASLHTRNELLGQPGLGRLSVQRVEKWMTFHGRRLRRNEESLDSVICRFGFRQAFIEERAGRASSVSVISPEDRDKVLRGMRGEQMRPPERLTSMFQRN